METITISEIFGPTIQGEGPYAGHPSVFVRLGRCNLDCKWCDTPYTWDWKGKNGIVFDPAVELKKMAIEEVIDEIRKNSSGNLNERLIITGGEPLLQRNGLEKLVHEIYEDDEIPIDIETNGTRPPLFANGVTYVVSPKISSSGVKWNNKWYESLSKLGEKSAEGYAFLKFVVCDEQDIIEINHIVKETIWVPWTVYLMPEGRTEKELNQNTERVSDLVLKHGYLYSDRLHVRLWGDERGH